MEIPQHPLTIAEVAQVLGYKSPQTVRKLIDSGKLKFYGEGRFVRVSPEMLSEYMAGNPERVPEDNGQISDEAQKTIQKMVDDTAIAKAETAKINAEIARDEATNRRDTPEVLKKRALELEDYANRLAERERIIREKEVAQEDRATVLKDKENSLISVAAESAKYYDERKKEADAFVTTCRAETNLKVAEQLKLAQTEADKIIAEAKESAAKIKFDSDALEIEFTNKKEKLDNLETKIVEAQKVLDAIGVKVKSFLPQVTAQTVAHYNKARQTTGQVSQYHDQKANQGWDLEKEIKKVLRSLGII